MDAAAWNERYSSKELLWSREPNQFVAEVVGELSPGRAVDLACGEGRNAIWLATRGWQVVAVDFSSTALERARALSEQAGVNVDWVEADLAEVALGAESFELILFSYLHLPAAEMAALLNRAAGWLAPGGHLLLIGHARRNLTQGIGGPQEARVLYEPDDVVAWLSRLTIERAENVNRNVETEDGPRQAIDTLVVAARPAS